MGEAPVIGADHVGALVRRDGFQIVLERLRIDPAAALLIEPFELGASEREDAPEHKLRHALRMRLRVSQRQRRAPGAPEHLPALDAEMLAQALDVVDQMPSRVLFERRVRRRASAATLIEEHDPVARRIVVAAHDRVGAAAGPAVQKHGGFSGLAAAFLVIELVQGRDLEPSGAVGSDLGIKRQPRAVSGSAFVYVVLFLHRSGAP